MLTFLSTALLGMLGVLPTQLMHLDWAQVFRFPPQVWGARPCVVGGSCRGQSVHRLRTHAHVRACVCLRERRGRVTGAFLPKRLLGIWDSLLVHPRSACFQHAHGPCHCLCSLATLNPSPRFLHTLVQVWRLVTNFTVIGLPSLGFLFRMLWL